MKKLIFAFVLALSMVLTSCDCDCNVEPVDLKSPEVQVYKLYDINNYEYNKLYVYKYETPDVYIYRFVISGETRNVNIVPKNQYANQPQENESIFKKDTYFDF